MRTILKHFVPVPGISFKKNYFEVEEHPQAQPLIVQLHDDTPAIWFLTDTNRGLKEKTFQFLVCTTGHDIPLDHQLVYMGTIQLQGIAWHYFFNVQTQS